jgi:hypothetical protein
MINALSLSVQISSCLLADYTSTLHHCVF